MVMVVDTGLMAASIIMTEACFPNQRSLKIASDSNLLWFNSDDKELNADNLGDFSLFAPLSDVSAYEAKS